MRTKLLMTAIAAALVSGYSFAPLQAADTSKSVSFNIKGAT
ncbi:MAG: hypothetical protein QGF00_06575 [Planctomycetota bacterium]|jgi:hypothetical protein|nr:hypothetical protein [Planctomycetota bacterium]MDP7249247.1 hypothetical protein [Planctomycetota bacterium]